MTESGWGIGSTEGTREGAGSEAYEDRGDSAQEEWAAFKKLAAGGTLYRLGWEHMAQEGRGEMAAEATTSGYQGGGSTMVTSG